jgi:hypothetical protein
MKSMGSDPRMWEAGNGWLLCCLAKGSTKPQVEISVANVPLCPGASVGVLSRYDSGWVGYAVSGSYEAFASIASMIS